tara:strand:+ start:51 stop:215 length:165 start_codon:yes stop_codon:yes gene_type:complete
MKTYQVSWTETIKYTIQVEAENKEDAQVNAFEQYDHEWDPEPEIEKDSIRVYEF